MSNDAAILIADASEAFARMFKEALEQDGGYRVTVATAGDEALQALDADEFDLVVVDLGLTDPDGATVARSLRRKRAGVRLMVIPLVGEDLPPGLADLDVQGTLPKPFYLPELPERIAAVLARPVRPPTPPEVRPDLVQELTALSQEISADLAIMTRGARLIAHAGRLSEEDADGLAQAVADSWRTSRRVARVLGREQLRFEQSVEGGEYLFYSLAIVEDVVLSVAVRADVPLGLIRHRSKRRVDLLRSLMSEEAHAPQ